MSQVVGLSHPIRSVVGFGSGEVDDRRDIAAWQPRHMQSVVGGSINGREEVVTSYFSDVEGTKEKRKKWIVVDH